MSKYSTGYTGEYQQLLDSFLRTEDELDLFSLKVNGVHIWERIRLSCFKKVLKENEVTNKAHTSTNTDLGGYLRGGYKWIKSIFIKNPFFEGGSDFFFIGTPRRKPRSDGYQWDLFCDPIIDSLDIDYMYTEPPYLLSHRRPAKTKNINYLDIITYTSVIQRVLNLANYDLSKSEREELSEVESKFEDSFNTQINLKKMSREKLNERKSRKWLYELLLNKINPKIAIIVAGAFKHTFIEVCKEKEIPVIELQHGGFGPDHMGYSFPEYREDMIFPDYLFVFGKFWKDSVEFPIPDENVYPVGYPYLEEEKEKYNNIDQRKQMIFLSQGPVGETMSRFATNFVEQNDEYEVVYKLHPGEYHRWKEDYPWLKDSDMRIVDDDETPLYELLAQSEIQVGVNSTVVWEGLNFGLDTYLIHAPGVERMQYLTDRTSVPVVSSVDEFESELDNSTNTEDIDIEYFFEPDAIQNINEALTEIFQKM